MVFKKLVQTIILAVIIPQLEKAVKKSKSHIDDLILEEIKKILKEIV